MSRIPYHPYSDIANFGQPSEFGKIVALYIVPVLVVIGTVGNGLILVTVRQRNLSNWSICFYLAAYAVVNIFILIPIIGLEWVCKVTETKYLTELTDWTCKLWQFVMNVVVYSGIWFVFAMLVDQYIAIWLPLKAPSMCNIFMAKFATIIIAVGLVVISIHTIWTYELFNNGCYINNSPDDLLTLIWPWVTLSSCVIIPLTLIVLFLILVVSGVLTKSTWKKSSSNYQVPIDITFMVIALSVFFVIFMTPATVLNIINKNMPNSWLHDQETYYKFQLAATIGELLSRMNPTFSFCMCFAFSSTFRQELVETMRNIFCKHVIRVYEMQVNSNGSTANEFEHCSETTPL